MARKHRRKKRYHSVTDRPLYKIIASVVTALTFGLLYYFVVILMENPGMAPIISVPSVLVLIWVAIKQRYFWWLWMVMACPCIVMMVLLQSPMVRFYLASLYWASSYAMSQWLILADSRARIRARKGRSSRHHHHHHSSDEPAAPRPRDELLEQLFANVE